MGMTCVWYGLEGLQYLRNYCVYTQLLDLMLLELVQWDKIIIWYRK